MSTTEEILRRLLDVGYETVEDLQGAISRELRGETETSSPQRYISAAEVEWIYHPLKSAGDSEESAPEVIFESAKALALLLLNEVVFLNDHWWQESWPEDARAVTSLSVNCSDVFAWGCADAEGMRYRDLELIYRMWIRDPSWGPAVWCMLRRREMPQDPVEKRIRDEGLWDLDALREEFGLRTNHYSGVSIVLARRKYETYTAWKLSRGEEALPFDAGWWAGWKEYTTANPDWWDDQWKAEDDRLVREFQEKNGFRNGGETVSPEPVDTSSLLERLRQEQWPGMIIDVE